MLGFPVAAAIAATVSRSLFPLGVIAVFLGLMLLFLFSIFNEVYYDDNHIYVKKFYNKQFEKFALEEIDEIDKKLIGPDIIIINGNCYFFTVKTWLKFKKDLLAYIRK